MLTRRAIVGLGSFVLLAIFAVPQLRGESFLLKSGGQIEGELLNPKRNVADPYVVKTSAGMQVRLARESVSKVIITREAEREYQRLLPKVPETAAGHWEMAKWCREQGLRTQREQQLQAVIALDPDHEQAHLALGQSKLGGKWQKMEDFMKSHGYVKHDGQWRPRQDVEIARAREEYEEEVYKWRNQIKIWQGWLGKKRDAEAIANLRQIRDPHAAPKLLELLQPKAQQPREVRLLMVSILSDIKGNPGEGAFINLALNDQDQGVADACLDQLVRSKSKLAVHRYIALLKDEKSMPKAINRAAVALGQLKDPIATPALIDALVTTHEVLIQPGQQSSGGLGPLSSSFGSDPGNPGSGSFSAGSAKPIKTKQNSQNQQVLAALNNLHPGVNFAFDETAWKKWYEQTHEPPQVNLRRGQ